MQTETTGFIGHAQPRIAVLIPALNEEDSIGEVVSGVPRDLVSRVIVADGGSRDATVELARSCGAEVIEVGRGYGHACMAAALAAADCEIVVFMDGDGADDTGAISALVTPILSGDFDFVIGSRSRGTRAPGSIAWHQLAAGYLAGAALWLRYGVRFSDMCAFRAVRRNALLELGMREQTYGWNLEMQMRAAGAGLRILEIPVDYRCRTGGRSKVAGSFSGSFKAAARLIITLARVSMSHGRAAQAPQRHGAGKR